MRFAVVAAVLALFATAAAGSSIQARCFPDTCNCNEDGCTADSPSCCAVSASICIAHRDDAPMGAAPAKQLV
ncbi:hypothetical protein GGX14DRAFT_570829 [Mycena pura]|uniref:Uncharacterized protein n=1 Tax=Mycena pura TaxID=153505 RepID=A0AAD6V801_9AGAR|nr:hypothetical protein GGX14DRAFT_570829 [Mycena pura]